MQQLRNSEAYLQKLQGTIAEFRKAIEFINKTKNDESGIFRDVDSGEDNLFTIEPFENYTASDSIYFGTYSDDKRFFSQPRTAFVKAFVNEKESEGMRVETCMYKNHVNDTMVSKMQTPNLVYYYGTASGFDLGNFTSDDIYLRGKQAYRSYPRQSLSRNIDKKYNNFIYNFTEYLPMTNRTSKFIEEDFSVSFSRFSKIRKENPSLITDKDFAQALFQLVYTLWIFEMNGFYHNDIHEENVIVSKNSSNREFIYVFEDEGGYNLIYMKPKFIIKIFDYDRSYDDNKVCYPNINRSGGYDPCHQGKEPDYTDCYHPYRKGYDFFRFLTSSQWKRNDIEMFFEKSVSGVMRRFIKLQRSKPKDLEAIGIKPMKEYIYRMMINNIMNGWFENATDNSEITDMLKKHPNAELYSYDMKETERYINQIQNNVVMNKPRIKRRKIFNGRKLMVK
jgi:hypothetical protein